MDLTYKIVRRLYHDDEVGFSRNKNFDAYEDPTVQRALRIYHHLESVESALLELLPGGDVELEVVDHDTDADYSIRLTFVDEHGRRVSYLRPGEWKLLLEHDDVAALARELVRASGAETREVLDHTFDEPA